MNLSGHTSDIFVGRQREMGELTSALEDAMAGHGRLVMLAGEPGIGKTRTAQELATKAESEGAQVLWGWCYEGEGAPPYWPWVQPIRTYIQQVDAPQLGTEMGPGAVVIAEIVPELQEKLPDLGQPTPAEPEQARFRLFDSVSNFLKNASQTRPLVFIIDDLHWADGASLLLLEFLAKAMGTSPLLLLGTYRDVEVTARHPLSRTLGSLIREQHFRRLQLGGLTQQEVGEFVQASVGVTLSSDAVDTVHRRTEGNPLFVGELVRLFSAEAMTEGQTWAETVPEGVRDAIGRRLARLSESCNRVLRTASVIGREFEFRQLAPITEDVSEDLLLEVLDEALEARVIEALPERAERYQFSHALIQQALTQELSPSRKVRLHARIGEAFEELYGADAQSHAAELAHHFREALSVAGPEKFVRYSSMAGEQALSRYAWEEALNHFQLALSSKGGGAMDEEKAKLYFGLGRAQVPTLVGERLQEAANSLSQAFDYYVGVGDVASAVAVAENPPSMVPGQRGGAELISRALDLVSQGTHEEGRLLSLYGRVKGQEGEYEVAQDSLDRALAIAQREGDAALELRTLGSAAQIDFQNLRMQACLEKSLIVIELAMAADDPRAEVIARYWTGYILPGNGDLAAGKGHALAALSLAERLGDRFWLASTQLQYAVLAYMEGDWPTARRYCEYGIAGAPRDPRLLILRVQLEFQVGDFNQGENYLNQLLEVMNAAPRAPAFPYAMPSFVIPFVGHITGKDSHFDVALVAAEIVLSSKSLSPVMAIVSTLGLALLSVSQGGSPDINHQYTALNSWSTFRMGANLATNLNRVLGLLSRTMGNPDQAAEHFEDALDFCRNAGYRPELAWTCHDYAETLRERNGPGDHAKVVTLLDESLAIASELGMRPLMERVIALQAQVESAPARAPQYPDGLSQREVEVLRLVAAGKSNREIGEDLFISVSTVVHHVSNILSKTSAANRTEAATYAAQRGLISS